MHNYLTVYITQGIILLAVLYLIFSGSLKRFFYRITHFKVGPVEVGATVDTAEYKGPERRKNCRRADDNFENRLKKVEEHIEEVWIDQLKQTFYNESPRMPLSEKLYAGLRYVWWGLNSQMKEDV